MVIQAQLRAIREAKGITQGQVAEAMGITQSSVSMFESGYKPPTLKTVERYCEAIGVELCFRPARRSPRHKKSTR